MILIQQEELESLNKLCKRQLSELLFLDSEVKFLRSLIENHFSLLLKEDYLNKAQQIISSLVQFNLIKENVVKEVLVQQGNLQAKINSSLEKSIDLLKQENERIATEIKDLNKLLKRIKKEIFNIYTYLPSLKKAKTA